MPTFEASYRKLNAAQKQAVDTIDGPVMVVAGPGTGKTQLLGMRVANILRQTDVNPGNILCLTFTDSGAAAMRARLAQLMGQEGYKVAVHTFHSFGTEIINHNPEYFNQGASFRPVDELGSYELFEEIFKTLPLGSPLASQMNDEFTALHDVRAAVGYLKKAGLTPTELRKVLDSNDEFIEFAEPALAKAFDVPRLSKKEIVSCRQALTQLETFAPKQPTELAKPLSDLCCRELEQALHDAQESNKTTSLTNWRNRWLERDNHKQYVFKDRARNQKLRTLADIYEKYQASLQTHELFDFDDMIMNVIRAVETHPELRYNLQEQYLYIMVDEFQDTNGAQLRLLQNLLDSESSNGRPDVMVVGDDDQAIYAFQGAELSNILQFHELYREPKLITLTENYRSTQTILDNARQVIAQGEDRLETALKNISKQLTANNKRGATKSEIHQFTQPANQFAWVAEEAGRLIKAGTNPSEIAIIARNHRQLLEMLPFLHQAGLSVDYERRSNVLEAEHITILVTMARVVVGLAEQRFDDVDALLPELLSHDLWAIPTSQLWQLSLNAYQQHRFWLELMLEKDNTRLHEIAEFLIIASRLALHQPLESILDVLLGSSEIQAPELDDGESGDAFMQAPLEEFVSPLRAYYFNQQNLEQKPGRYLSDLGALATIRRKLRDWRPDRTLDLGDFVDFIDLHQKAGINLVDTSELADGAQAIKLLTAHKAKGLEFDAVFVLSCQEDIWGEGARHRHSQVSFPHNLEIEPAGQTGDDCLRLFFVAMTRARHELYLCSYQANEAGKESTLASFLLPEAPRAVMHNEAISPAMHAKTLEPGWQARHLIQNTGDWRELLRPNLANYRLSATHLNNFIDVTSGGPQAFLLQNLLRFPQAKTPQAAFGSAIHAVLRRAHVHVTQTGERRPTEDILHDFELQLQQAHLSDLDHMHLLEKGSAVLSNYLTANHELFHPAQKAEYAFRDVAIGDVHITGTIDLLEVDTANRRIIVTDYKTGKAPNSWQGTNDYEKIKLHKYRQQLMMYKLLIENSGEFGEGFSVEQAQLDFIEADTGAGQLTTTFDPSELNEFSQLITVIWRCITTLQLPDTKSYGLDYKAVMQFEHDLLNSTLK
ncbi:MAG TPA: ATP-dependent DNA helicase [Candidatus Acidoferrum sp.]|nr:ATP-dependent DNA helicase [Candidatus Acidoferrum sp.]